ncbi:universal stress protein [Nocardioides sp. TRM66260-LWL]|uniref:universal stress protein n=1 Tax=Nocardioides sp. TRM66260-LWL TaxID=2874478 RepID=UPI001CC78498|nr:universal stress protein [Nocardioides sp. TRM66260-LWL]MBZ5736102.1 universal stress protein [Nocardioides sp. TRM66260-LWL]
MTSPSVHPTLSSDDPTPLEPGSVVVGVDGSGASDHALRWAAEQAVGLRRPLAVVHAVPPVASPVAGWRESADVDVLRDALRVEGRARLLAAQLRLHERHPGLAVRVVLRDGDPRVVLPEVAADAALLAVAPRGVGGAAHLLLGSVSATLARHAVVPTAVVRRGPGPSRGVLVGVEGTPAGWDVLEAGFRLASARGWRLTALHVVACGAGADDLAEHEDGHGHGRGHEYRHEHRHDHGHAEAAAELDAVLAGFVEKFPDVEALGRVAVGRPDEVLVRASEGRALTVVGAERRGPVGTALFGSVAGAVVEHAASSVVVVPMASSAGRRPTRSGGERGWGAALA